MEKRKRMRQLEKNEEIPVPQPNNSEKNFSVAATSNPLLAEMHAKLDEAMKGFPDVQKEIEMQFKPDSLGSQGLPVPAQASDDDQIKEIGPIEPQNDILESKETVSGDRKVGQGGLMDRKFNKYVKADEVFESDD